MKLGPRLVMHQRRRRSPRGERGLKRLNVLVDLWDEFVAPHAGSVD